MPSAPTRWTPLMVPCVVALSLALALAANTSADPGDPPATDTPVAGVPGSPIAQAPDAPVARATDPPTVSSPAVGQIQAAAPIADDPSPAAVDACGRFAVVLQGTAVYYDNFAEALETYEQPEYAEVIRKSNTLSRTALREGAAEALSASNTPGLVPDIASPMRSWSLDATKLLIKMGLRGTGETLDTTVAEMNNNAYTVQLACAAAGTHA